MRHNLNKIIVFLVYFLLISISFSYRLILALDQEFNISNSTTISKYGEIYVKVENITLPSLLIHYLNQTFILRNITGSYVIKNVQPYSKIPFFADIVLLDVSTLINSTFRVQIIVRDYENFPEKYVTAWIFKIGCAKLEKVYGSTNVYNLSRNETNLFNKITFKFNGEKATVTLVYRALLYGICTIPRGIIIISAKRELKNNILTYSIFYPISVYLSKKVLVYPQKKVYQVAAVVKNEGNSELFVRGINIVISKSSINNVIQEIYLSINRTLQPNETLYIPLNNSIILNESKKNLIITLVPELDEQILKIEQVTVRIYTSMILVRIFKREELCPLILLEPFEITMKKEEVISTSIVFSKKTYFPEVNITLHLSILNDSIATILSEKTVSLSFSGTENIKPLNIKIFGKSVGITKLIINDSENICKFSIPIIIREKIEEITVPSIVYIKKTVVEKGKNQYDVEIYVLNPGTHPVTLKIIDKYKGKIISTRGFIVKPNTVETDYITLSPMEDITLKYSLIGTVSRDLPTIIGENIIPRTYLEVKSVITPTVTYFSVDQIITVLQILLAFAIMLNIIRRLT